MIKFDNKVITINNGWLKYDTTPVDPYNPLGLPSYTIRLKYTDGVTPTFSKGTGVQVSSSPNVWDLTFVNNDWTDLLYNSDVTEVLGANTTGVTNMRSMFAGCFSLLTVPLFNTSNVTNMTGMFFVNTSLQTLPLFDTSKVTQMANMCYQCNSLKSIPLFNTSQVLNMEFAFSGCILVETGALALYQQASSQTNIPEQHYRTFHDCGAITITGAAELSQIPSDWKD